MHHDLDVSMAYYSKKSSVFWQYYRDEPATTILSSESFKSKIKIIEKTCADGNAKNVKKAIPLNAFVIFGKLLKCL